MEDYQWAINELVQTKIIIYSFPTKDLYYPWVGIA